MPSRGATDSGDDAPSDHLRRVPKRLRQRGALLGDDGQRVALRQGLLAADHREEKFHQVALHLQEEGQDHQGANQEHERRQVRPAAYRLACLASFHHPGAYRRLHRVDVHRHQGAYRLRQDHAHPRPEAAQNLLQRNQSSY